MISDYKKQLTIILLLIMISSMFAGFVFNVKQFTVRVIVSFGAGTVYDNEVRVSANTTAVEALSLTVGDVRVNNSLIECINNLCNGGEGEWTAFNTEEFINPLTHTLSPGETIMFAYDTNNSDPLTSDQQADYEAIRELLKLN